MSEDFLVLEARAVVLSELLYFPVALLLLLQQLGQFVLLIGGQLPVLEYLIASLQVMIDTLLGFQRFGGKKGSVLIGVVLLLCFLDCDIPELFPFALQNP